METGKWLTAWWGQSRRSVSATTREPSERQSVGVSKERTGPCHEPSSDVGPWSRSEKFSTDPVRPWAHGLF
jgi:hypothetical protein